MARIDELRLMTKVAQLYYEQDLRQTEIAENLNLSQSTVSRLLKRAEEEQIVRVTVSVPRGVHTDLEEALVANYGLHDAVVADCVRDDDDESVARDIGRAAAYYLETTLNQGECIGVSSWSSTILAMVEVMRQIPRPIGARVIQILGGAGEPQAKVHAAYLASRLAELVRGDATFLPAPGLVDSADVRQVLLNDSSIREVIESFDEITLALVGIGTVEPSPLLASSGNIFSDEELDMLREKGAVGDILYRFFDAEGNPVQTPLADRVTGMDLDQLQRVERVVGVAGGARKFAAIRGALRGKLINTLITDRFTAERLVQM
ncbi:MAG: winged helix-turn-helix transcriptional regulator [Chloroflexi bacterium]|nr:winged helix-turn-helix transcriptional regulator [Chloroflexota bacterium]